MSSGMLRNTHNTELERHKVNRTSVCLYKLKVTVYWQQADVHKTLNVVTWPLTETKYVFGSVYHTLNSL